MNAVAATNVLTVRATAPGAGRVARRATASRAVASTPRVSSAIGPKPNTAVLRAGRVRCRAAEGEEKDTMSSLDAILAGSEDKDAPAEEPEPAPAPPERKPGEVSEAMKKKLLGETVGLGGTPSKPMPSNLFLNIIIGISAIAVLVKLSGVLG